IVLEESNLIRNGSIVALKHVATGKYLSSIKNLCYTTGSQKQLIFVGSSEPIPNSLWKIEFSGELATYAKNSIKLQHVKSERLLGIYCVRTGFNRYIFYRSPLNNHTEGYLKSNDIINLSSTGRMYHDPDEFLRSHDIHFTIGNDTFQEVVCHNERLGGNDEWCIELIYES
ncbi:hypothetical protein RhiirA4_482961, partial [Rhizophagus irregularis]